MIWQNSEASTIEAILVCYLKLQQFSIIRDTQWMTHAKTLPVPENSTIELWNKQELHFTSFVRGC